MAIKRAEDSDAMVVRLYEAWGGRCRAGVNVPGGERATLCDLLERERSEVTKKMAGWSSSFGPFKSSP